MKEEQYYTFEMWKNRIEWDNQNFHYCKICKTNITANKKLKAGHEPTFCSEHPRSKCKKCKVEYKKMHEYAVKSYNNAINARFDEIKQFHDRNSKLTRDKYYFSHIENLLEFLFESEENTIKRPVLGAIPTVIQTSEFLPKSITDHIGDNIKRIRNCIKFYTYLENNNRKLNEDFDYIEDGHLLDLNDWVIISMAIWKYYQYLLGRGISKVQKLALIDKKRNLLFDELKKSNLISENADKNIFNSIFNPSSELEIKKLKWNDNISFLGNLFRALNNKLKKEKRLKTNDLLVLVSSYFECKIKGNNNYQAITPIQLKQNNFSNDKIKEKINAIVEKVF